MSLNNIAIIGTGPAGLGCAYELSKAGQRCLVIEKEDACGGLCRTIDYHGYSFDIGGHRFLSKSEEINQLWHDVMGQDFLTVSRLSRIYYKKRYFNYPLSFLNTLWNLGLFESGICFVSCCQGKFLKKEIDSTFEGWIVNRFGRRLFEIFFKTYTEKVWAVDPKNISADWAKQRIRGLSLRVAIQKAIFGFKKNAPKTLSEKFLYPGSGAGEFYVRMKDQSVKRDAQFMFGKTVTRIRHNNHKITSLELQGLQGTKEELPAGYLFSSMPLSLLVQALDPLPGKEVVEAANRLRFRSLLTVNIILDKEKVFPDQWLYIHSPEVKLGRIQNYKNWSSRLVADSNKTSLGLEYFCDENDKFWNMNDVDLIDYALNELEKIGIVSRRYLISGFVLRCPNAYPVYSLEYKDNVKIIRSYLSEFSNFQTIGRAGLFRYDNSDHAMLTGLYAARNFLGKANYDIWALNTDEAYLES